LEPSITTGYKNEEIGGEEKNVNATMYSKLSIFMLSMADSRA